MPDRSSWGGMFRRAARVAGRKFEEVTGGDTIEEAKESYEAGKRERTGPDLPTNDDGEARIVCRRYAEKRAVAVDAKGRPECYDADHPDCEGCVADIEDGRVETW
jgi:hypothetical protein